jgi:hypothetical protein
LLAFRIGALAQLLAMPLQKQIGLYTGVELRSDFHVDRPLSITIRYAVVLALMPT